MKQNKNKEPMKETTKDDSSDIKKVKQDQASAQQKTQSPGRGEENKEAQKGHA